MAVILQFGIGLGLAGVSGLRAYFPLIAMGLLTRFSEILAYRSSFRVLGSIPILLLLIIVAFYELALNRIPGYPERCVMLTAGLRIIGGALVFDGVFGGFGTFLGFIFGGLLTLAAYLMIIRLKMDYIPNYNRSPELLSGLEETTAVAGTILVILMPWTSFLLWGAVVIIFISKLRRNSWTKPDLKVRTGR